MRKKKILYYGWLGHKNIGDEAVYLANKLLFSEYDLVTNYEDENANTTLLGGCTMLPGEFRRKEGSRIRKSRLNYAIGMGIQDPDFFRFLGRFETRPLTARRRLKVPAGKIGGAMRLIDNKLNNPLKLYDCFTDYDYEKIRNFGFNRIGVRGPRSQEILAQYGIPSTIVGDTALYLKPTEYNYEKNYKIAICIRDKGMKWEESKNYLKEIISFCNSLSDDYRFVILPIYPPDVKINKTISGKINNSKILDFSDNVNINGLLDEITTCDLMIGEKLHSNVLSACCHVPFISIEYDPKSTDFVKTLELEMLNIRIGRVSEEKLDSLFHEIINNDKILNKLKSNVEKLRTKLEEFAESIKQEIDTYNN